jgi:phosphoglycolate phosphatase
MIDGVIFDKDGTLFDFRASWGSWAAALLGLLARDPDHAAELARAVGFDLVTHSFAPDSQIIAASVDVIAADLLPLLPGRTLDDLVAQMNDLAAGAVMMPAVPLRPVLGALRARGLKIGLATNDAQSNAHVHLESAGVRDLFDFVAGFDSGHGAKPLPGQLLAFARQMSLDPARVAMVGDSCHDLDAGRAAGMHAVAVLTGVATAEELTPHADVVLADIGALGAWIDQLAAT